MEQFSGMLANSFGAFSLQPVITEHDWHACPTQRRTEGNQDIPVVSVPHRGGSNSVPHKGGSNTVLGQRVGQVQGVNPLGLGDMCDHSSVIILPLKHNAVKE